MEEPPSMQPGAMSDGRQPAAPANMEVVHSIGSSISGMELPSSILGRPLLNGKNATVSILSKAHCALDNNLIQEDPVQNNIAGFATTSPSCKGANGMVLIPDPGGTL